MNRFKVIFKYGAFVVLGIVIGGYLFAKSQPRSFLALNQCIHCLAPNELAGLVGSVIVNATPALLQPVVVLETDKTLVIKNPKPENQIDFVVIPKKDIKDAGELSQGGSAYLIDAYAVMQRLAEKYHLREYQIKTYGPGWQSVRYLHFHLESGPAK